MTHTQRHIVNLLKRRTFEQILNKNISTHWNTQMEKQVFTYVNNTINLKKI